MSQDRAPSALIAIGWLFLLHGLADVMVGIYRCHDVDRALTDLLAASLTRSQLCLLAIWLVAGTERFSWRICGMIAGGCFLFIVFSRFVFPGAHDIARDVIWLDEEWMYYFRLSAPGDLLIKAPVLIAGIVVPLLVWRGWRAIRNVRRPGSSGPGWARWLRFQFHMQDAIVWIVTLSVVLAAVYRTAPYPGWFAELFGRWRQLSRLETAPDVYCAASALLYLLVAFVSLWSVYAKVPLRFRIPIAAALVTAPAWGFEVWLRHIAQQAASKSLLGIWGQASAETVTSVVAMIVMAGSLSLVRLYGRVSARRRRRRTAAFGEDSRRSAETTARPPGDNAAH